jgi:hypothetical protein
VNILREKLQGKALEMTDKLGFILTDYFEDIGGVLDNILLKKEPTLAASDRMNTLKYLRNVQSKEKAKEYWFRRSIFVSFEISYDNFTYGSYNLSPEVDR